MRVTDTPVAGVGATAVQARAHWWERFPEATWDPRWDGRVVAVLVALAAALRIPNLQRGYWVDEGISIGIAGHPLTQVPGLLRHDGSPPLFYVLLHYWTSWFGTGEAATHSLSLAISLAVVVVAWRCGREVAGRSAGLAAAALAATNPYLNWYATETRMYTLVCGLSLLSATLALRALRTRRAADAAATAVAVTALDYTHTWGVWLTVALAAVVAARALVDGDRGLLRATALTSAAVLVAFAPWLPSLLAQARSTAAPWAVPPGIGDLVADPASLLAGTLGFLVAPLLVAGVVWTRAERRSRPGGAVGAGFLGAVAVTGLLLGWMAAQVDPSWTVRYLGVLLGPLLLGAAAALAVTSRGRAVIAVVCAACTLWGAIGSLLPNPSGRDAKSNGEAVAAAARPDLRSGDLVVVAQTEQLAMMAHYLPPGLTYVTPTGAVGDPTVVDWRDLVARLRSADVCRTVLPAIAALPPGASVLEVNPLHRIGASGTAWSRAANGDVAAVDRLLAMQPSLEATRSFTEGTAPRPFSAVVGELFVKRAGAVICPL